MNPRVYIPNSVYLASRFSRQAEMRDVRKTLHNVGILVTSTWLDAQRDDGEASEKACARAADQNFRDIAAAEFFVTFTEGPWEHNSFSTIADELAFHKSAARGGRHVEFGFAAALGVTVIKIGPKENVFHYHPAVRNAVDLDTAIGIMHDLRREGR